MSGEPVNMSSSHSVGLLLVQRLRRRSSNKPTPCDLLPFAGKCVLGIVLIGKGRLISGRRDAVRIKAGGGLYV